MVGRFEAIQRSASCLSVTVDDGAPKPQEKGMQPWAGISGAPIFVAEGRNEGWLYGIVRKQPKSFGDRLWAVATPALLRDPSFCSVLDLKEPPPPHERLVESSRRLLKESPDLARQLAARDDEWRAAWEEGNTEGLLEAVCREGSVRTLLEGLRMLAETRKEDPQEMRCLRDSAVHLVGLLAHHELVRQGGLKEKAAGRYLVPVASRNFAEAVAAATDGGPTRYVQREGNLPGPELEVPTTDLEWGIRTEALMEDQLEELSVALVEKDLDQPRPGCSRSSGRS